jgi:tetratricopeptide (TPR) repeat protein
MKRSMAAGRPTGENNRFGSGSKKLIMVMVLFVSSLPAAFAQNDWEVFSTDNPLFNMLGEYQYNITAGDIASPVKTYQDLSVDPNSAVSLNTFGYHLYERKAYADAATAFRRAVQLDPAYAFPHYNLACVLSLKAGEGKSVDPGELIYHLQCAALLDPRYRTKPQTDTDLDPVRSMAYFRDYLGMLERGRVVLDGKGVYIKTDADKVLITALREESAGPLFINPKITESPDKKEAAFIAVYHEEHHVYILTSWGLLIKVTAEPLGDLQSVFYCDLVWHPQNKGLLYAPGSVLMYYEIARGGVREVLQAPGKVADNYIDSFADYHFISPVIISFMGGGYFEYSFAGEEYEVRLDGSGFRKVPGGRVEHGEDLRGGGGD